MVSQKIYILFIQIIVAICIQFFLYAEMMQESKLTNFQQRHLEKTLRGELICCVHCISYYFIISINYAENFQTDLIKVKVISVPVNACLFNHGKSNNCYLFCFIKSGGGSLPTQCAPTSSAKKKPTSAPKKESKVLNAR